MSTPRALKIAARKYAEMHDIGYQKALYILFDPIRSVIAQNTTPHLWIEGSEFSSQEWYWALTIAESDSPIDGNFMVTTMSPIKAMGQRGDLLLRAGLSDIWELRQAERAGTLNEIAIEYKRSLGIDPLSVTPIILHVSQSPALASMSGKPSIDETVTYYGAGSGVYQIYVDNGEETSLYPKKATSVLSHSQTVEWVRQLMQTDRAGKYLELLGEGKRSRVPDSGDGKDHYDDGLLDKEFHNTQEEREDLEELIRRGVDITIPLEEQSKEAQDAYFQFAKEKEG